MKPILNSSQAAELFSYDQLSGILSWRVSRGKAKAGTHVTGLNSKGYLKVCVNGRYYLAHRVAWLIVTGDWPDGIIDHRNGDRTDNRWLNLRDVSHSMNTQNQRVAHPGNRTKLLGVYEKRGRFNAKILAKGKSLHLGTFDTPELAHEAYVAAKRIHHPGCTI